MPKDGYGSVTLDNETLAAIDEGRKRTKRSRAQYLRAAVQAYRKK